jgi:hypothetical protein
MNTLHCDDTYISADKARKILGLSARGFKAVRSQDVIGIRQYPGLPPRFRLADVERLKAEAVRPAGGGVAK